MPEQAALELPQEEWRPILPEQVALELPQAEWREIRLQLGLQSLELPVAVAAVVVGTLAATATVAVILGMVPAGTWTWLAHQAFLAA